MPSKTWTQVVYGCCQLVPQDVGLNPATNIYNCPKRIDVHVQLDEIFKLDHTTLILDSVLVQDEHWRHA